MKILVITDLYPIIEDEIYTPKTIYNFVLEWQKQGHEVKVIKPNFILNSFIRKKPYYKSGMYGNVENINYWFPFLGNIKNKIKTDFEPDIIISHMPSGLIFARKFINNFKKNIKFCAAVHNSDIEVLTNPIYGIYFKSELEKAYKSADCIACRSYVLKNKFLNLYPQYEDKTFAAPSGIDDEYIIKRKWEQKEKIKVLTCGRFIKNKNIDKVIKTCDEIDGIELTVIGSGKEDKILRKLSDKPIFTGQISHEKVLEKMRESDIFVLPSVKETFGMVYLEAMASGCITVCTKNDGIDGIIKDSENGFLTNPEELKETLIRIINLNDKNAILDKAAETANHYTKSQTAENYLKNIFR